MPGQSLWARVAQSKRPARRTNSGNLAADETLDLVLALVLVAVAGVLAAWLRRTKSLDPSRR